MWKRVAEVKDVRGKRVFEKLSGDHTYTASAIACCPYPFFHAQTDRSFRRFQVDNKYVGILLESESR